MKHQPLSDPHLDRLLTEAEGVYPETDQIVSGLTERQLLWRPSADAWSIAECFHHLIVTNRQYYPRVQKAIEETRLRGLTRKGPFRPSWFGRQFIESAGPRIRFRIKAFKVFQPATQPPATSPQDFLEQQGTLVELIRLADGLDLSAIKVPSPALRFLALRLGEALTMLVVHEYRHLGQAARVKQAPGFPAS
ncbi:MAG TPA: DinB family protein [Thermoanaerobaculia bacterium]|nr:DinB family protein [Thermoanaerobaculia bacterium]